MKILVVTFAALATALGFGPAIQADHAAAVPTAQDPHAPQGPGPEHAILHKRVGTWDAVVITVDEKGVEQKSKGTMTARKLSDFHTAEDYQGEFMGMKFTGHGMHGYCTVKKQYFTFWVDSMVPSPMSLTGSYDQKKKVQSMTGESLGMTGKFEPCRTEIRDQDDDHYTFVLFGPGQDTKEAEHLRIEYTRKK